MNTSTPDHHSYQMAALSLTRHELAELDNFLASEAVPDGLWGVDVLHGFLTSVALSPTEIETEQWLPLVWSTRPEEPPWFDSSAQEQRLASYVLRMYDDILLALADPDSGFTPLVAIERDFRGESYADGKMWCNGFMLGIILMERQWTTFLSMPTGGCLLLPILLLGSDSVPPGWEGMAETPEKRARLTAWIPAVVVAVHLQRFIVELIALKESGRLPASAQDPCECGSRRAFRVCCGAPHRLH